MPNLSRVEMLGEIIDSLVTGITVQQKALDAAVNLISDLIELSPERIQRHYGDHIVRFKKMVTDSETSFAPVVEMLRQEKATRQ